MSYYIISRYNSKAHYSSFVFFTEKSKKQESIYIDELESFPETEISYLQNSQGNESHLLISKQLVLQHSIEVEKDGRKKMILPNNKNILTKLDLTYEDYILNFAEEEEYSKIDNEFYLQMSVRNHFKLFVSAYNEELAKIQQLRLGKSIFLENLLLYLFSINYRSGEKIREFKLTQKNLLEDFYINGEQSIQKNIQALVKTELVKIRMLADKHQAKQYHFTIHPQLYRIVFHELHTFCKEESLPMDFKNLFTHEYLGKLYSNHYNNG